MTTSSIKDAYCSFLNTRHGAEVYRQFKRILYGSTDSLIQVLDTQIFEHLISIRRSPVRICDIGGGDGERVMCIAAFLHEKFQSQIKIDFIEQSALYVEEFKRRHKSDYCVTKAHCARFEHVDFNSHRFDLVLLIHSIFAFENVNSVDKIISLRETHGNIVVASNDTNSFLGGLKLLVDEGFDDRRYEISDLKQALQNRGIQFREFTFQTEWAIENENYDRDILLILDWITLGRYSVFTQSKKNDILRYIESQSIRNGGRFFFKENEVVLVIPDI
ncbi:hypothetical protein Paes_0623 [Prosthecochloris aestuarii DSM 271]|uniref:Uncharacterized protein n=1 Tax=Prosthecochloris aestuarii (strain DSM 271 / SK 413) TaxID=290512 RepID=B4S627_PROA2|nr:class I SAM-dependent methyltransferase [Prosthecochloris aestuarii]ACF45678.1 hypothetical protein Paes_0623 [Prosthecochloris aestuarii DSM 271]